MKKVALITGITGQDGSYLAEFLIDKGYEVHGLRRRVSSFNTGRIDHLLSDVDEKIKLHYGEMTDSLSIHRVIESVRPHEIYNLAAQSHVAVSFEEPEYTANSDALGTLRILESMRTIYGASCECKFYQASTSELFGKVVEIPQTEDTPFYPRSPYGVAKLYAYWITKNYREAYDMYACNGILFNHESPRRGETFVTRKITRALAAIALGSSTPLVLGNLDSLRDWGHAKDYVEMQWLMMQQESASDYVIATGRQFSVRQFVEIAASYLGFTIEWSGSGINEKGFIVSTSKSLSFREDEPAILVSPKYFRPSEVETLLGDASLAKRDLGWEPKISFEDMVAEMMEADLKQYKDEAQG